MMQVGNEYESFGKDRIYLDAIKKMIQNAGFTIPLFTPNRPDAELLAGDTFLDLRGWGKGVVWVNGHNLGRYWRIGLQQALYCPAPFLTMGHILDLEDHSIRRLQGLKDPICRLTTSKDTLQ